MSKKSTVLYTYSHWSYILAGLSLIGFLTNCLIFYPGYMSNDSISQLSQAIGTTPTTDLFPPAMTLVWRILIEIFGKVSIMLIFQLVLLWTALFLFARYAWKRWNSRGLSISALGIGLLPFVVNISGVIWKDNQMAFSLLLAVTMLLFLPYVKNKKWRISSLVIILLLIAYACLVRYNALVALVPIIFAALNLSGLFHRKKIQFLVTGVVCLAILGAFTAINAATHAKSSNPIAAVMIDDIVNIGDESSIQASMRSSGGKRLMTKMQVCSIDKKVVLNNFWVCADDTERSSILFKYAGEIKSAWLSLVTGHPVRYVLYRTYTYALFLFPPRDSYFIWQDGIVPNDLDLSVKQKRLGEILNIYITNFSYKHFSFLFEPWFWFFGSIILLIYSQKKITGNHKLVIKVLTLSSLLYMLSYLPTGATIDYRYIYWPAIAGTVSLAIFSFDMYSTRRSHFVRKKASNL